MMIFSKALWRLSCITPMARRLPFQETLWEVDREKVKHTISIKFVNDPHRAQV